MLSELWQEILALKEDRSFARNLAITTIATVTVTLGFAEVYNHPTRIAQQQRISEFSGFLSVGMVIRTYQIPRR
jgi:hypothetical protein